MDWKKAEMLIEKYWAGTTSIEEENWLKRHRKLLSGTEKGGELVPLIQFWDSEKDDEILPETFDEEVLNAIKKVKPIPDKKHQIKKIKYWPVAAALAVLLTAGIVLKNDLFRANTQDTFNDPQEAFEATKMALLLVSEKLNEGKAQAARINVINQVEQNLKSE